MARRVWHCAAHIARVARREVRRRCDARGSSEPPAPALRYRTREHDRERTTVIERSVIGQERLDLARVHPQRIRVDQRAQCIEGSLQYWCPRQSWSVSKHGTNQFWRRGSCSELCKNLGALVGVRSRWRLAAQATVAADTNALRFRSVEGVDGVPLNVVEAGDPSKPGILFVHGIGQSYLSFERQLHSPLAAEFHLVAYDLRGHGNSGKPWNREAYVDSAKWAGDLERVRIATGLEHPVLLGWSYGTLVTADYLRHFGSNGLAGIVLIGAYGGLTPPPANPRPGASPPQGVVARTQGLREAQTSPNLESNIEVTRRVTTDVNRQNRCLRSGPTARYIIGMLLPGPAHAWMFDRLDGQSGPGVED